MTKHPWWQTAVIYQIYLRSFQDSNSDGIGDLAGLMSRVDYLSWLGIDAVWITPFFPSPMADFGYDVSDHTDVDPTFGHLSDFECLVQELHSRNIRIVIDFVAAHTSSQHSWFLDSCSSRYSSKRNWYIWKDAAGDGQPPNNWIGRFDGLSAWEFDPHTKQYYLHSFLKEQPDLNWRDPDCEAAMLGVLDFWMAKGVDGFRVDAAYRAYKDPDFRDNPINPDWKPGMEPSDRLYEVYNKNVPDIHDFNRKIRSHIDTHGGILLAAELYKPLEIIVQHHGTGDEFHLPLNSELMSSDLNWEANAVKQIIERYEQLLPRHAWPNWSVGNHDKHRVVSRLGIDQARIAMMLLLTLRGTPTIYYGDELGMKDAWIPPEHIQDPWELKAPGIGVGRDPERTPMLWNDQLHAGFCSDLVQPWLPISGESEVCNVEHQKARPRSFLMFTRTLLFLRRKLVALQLGEYSSLYSGSGILCFLRRHLDDELIVALNFTSEAHTWVLPQEYRDCSQILLSSTMDRVGGALGESVFLRANEGLIIARHPLRSSPPEAEST